MSVTKANKVGRPKGSRTTKGERITTDKTSNKGGRPPTAEAIKAERIAIANAFFGALEEKLRIPVTAQLERELDLPPSTISDLTKGRRPFTDTTAMRATKALFRKEADISFEKKVAVAEIPLRFEMEREMNRLFQSQKDESERRLAEFEMKEAQRRIEFQENEDRLFELFIDKAIELESKVHFGAFIGKPTRQPK